MNIAIQGWKRESSPDIPSHVINCLHYAVGGFSERIEKVSVHLKEPSPPSENVNKCCQIVLQLRQGTKVVVEKQSPEWLDLVDQATLSVSQEVERISAQETSQTSEPLH